MKKQVTLLFLTLLCLGLAALPAMAQVLFSSGPHVSGPSAGGVNIDTPLIAPQVLNGVSWNCSTPDCDVTGVTFWVFNGLTGGSLPTSSSLQEILVSQRAFGFDQPGSIEFAGLPVSQVECEPFVGANQICDYQADFGRSFDFPHGTNWLALGGMAGGPALTWSHSSLVPPNSTTLQLDLTNGNITPYPTALAFDILGTPTTVPEPGSIMLLGSGLLGLAGVIRRKLVR